MTATAHKPSFLSNLLAPLTGVEQIQLEKSRLEAFLNAFPGEYCGFHKDGSVAYSDGFLTQLNLSSITRIEDIQGALTASDAAALEGQYLELEASGKPFSIKVQCADRLKLYRLRGAAGAALDGADQFNILWLEDITEEDAHIKKLQTGKETAEQHLLQFQNTLLQLDYPVWIRESSGDLAWVNEAYATLVGNTRESIIDAQQEIVLSPKNKSKSPREMAREAINEGRKKTGEYHLIAAGKRLLMLFTETPLPGFHKTIGFGRDLTKEEELNSALERHIAAQKSVLEQLRTAIALFDADHTIRFFNSAFGQLWGLDDNWLNTHPKLGDILEKLRENRRLPEQADFRKYKQGWLDLFTRLIESHEDMLYLPDGSALRMIVTPHPLGGLMMTFEDVTSRLELESSYNTLIAVQKETLDNLAEAVVVYGGDGRVRLWNPAFLKLWGLHPEDMEPAPHIAALVERKSGYFSPDLWRGVRNTLLSMGLEREEMNGRLARSDGVYLLYATVPLPDGGVMVSYYDTTDSTRIEHALREKNAALEAAEQLKTDFLANVSYQLRTPLNTIMGFSEILEKQYFGPMNDRQKDYASGIQEAGNRLVGLIDDILDLATIEAGYMELNKTDITLATLLESVRDMMLPWARKQNLEITLNCPSKNVLVYADEQRLRQAILNLVRNAINFTQENGIIEILGDKIGDKIRISVTDSGIGIPAEDLGRIFEPFERLSQGAKPRTGAGLGLTLVKNIIELHKGTLSIESKVGTGTTVQMTLPPKDI